jgi:hypothetical protein
VTSDLDGDEDWRPSDVGRIFANFASRKDRPEGLADAALALYVGGYDDWIADLCERADARGLDPDTIQICLANAQKRAADPDRRKKDKAIFDREIGRHNGKQGPQEPPAEPAPQQPLSAASNGPGDES